ncbi:MAG: hydroxymethylbilane synthase [Nitrospinaceae bacterium]|jgi:hydroxymethylbilane synthase|nr:hydroxymethylbilane synthase [Nitrospinaceae bacterium]MBT3434965.1 hydroxymethylbilane synthase [Nitrospinaceae bacterium]MBT3821084.1 hydroxymethylbilane synthase [Nitrospinaceae bacterium]MBT4094479.1 hydroxymethylbilane synthase [Nitrospinaceae bacterium]MBT4430206.1 hydroxymethylbilane synthase [Nitrospinaceae bacterium]
MIEKLRLGTRGSALALAQSRQMAARIKNENPGLEVEEIIIRTRGDEILDAALHEVGGKGLFVTEIEEQLLDGRIDLAVHSLKDLPGDLPAGLKLGAVPEREEPWDVLVSRGGESIRGLPPGSRVGTSSLRRQAQLKRYRNDLDVVDLRGNVDTRLRKVSEGEVAGAILAAAGLNRLGHGERVTERLAPELMLPAVGQGALGLEVREGDSGTMAALAGLDHEPTRQAVAAERSVMAYLEGGCQVPLAAFAEFRGDVLHLRGIVASLDGQRVIQAEQECAPEEGIVAGEMLARQLLELGGGKILQEIRNV